MFSINVVVYNQLSSINNNLTSKNHGNIYSLLYTVRQRRCGVRNRLYHAHCTRIDNIAIRREYCWSTEKMRIKNCSFVTALFMYALNGYCCNDSSLTTIRMWCICVPSAYTLCSVHCVSTSIKCFLCFNDFRMVSELML